MLLIGTGLVLMLVGVAGCVAANSFVGTLNASVETGAVLDDASLKQDLSAGRNLRGPIDLLLLGLDTRSDWEENTSRADSILVLHVPASHDQAYLMSIPRDALVEIPPYPKAGFYGTQEKANAAYYFGSQNGLGWRGGAALTAKMVHEVTGLTFSGVVVIDFKGFRGIIDALGSVRMCVDQETISDHYVVEDGKPVYAKGKPTGVYYRNSYVHEPGCREMPGWEALDFARQRKGGPNGDYDRQRHQQQLLKAIATKATSAGIITNPLRINDLIAAAGGSLKIDTGRADLTDFAFTLKSLATADLVMLKTNGGTFNSAQIRKTSAELLDDETLEMFTAAAEDRLGLFVLDHPEVLIDSR
ncbi:LCP family protein required for cell wall assembly [Allocatelliglobosispora scoriae]|uniref:LCP family protein required for cell wall assembly n=1 Tax=Allocatelliglobosispora scoriae TaxID=643052 RepID=A0A841BLA2_9ACTN|nr:LCP family protein [Allocatelliglobosispora scoriae]MBB5868026.1 LCP family protein required for cell wall assembly [Allocatelliglobosispora scoriae]